MPIFSCAIRLASGVIPQISAIMGPCAGGAVYSPAITDFNVMVQNSSYMFVTGPDVIKTVMHEDVSKEDLGGPMTHNATSGVAHFIARDDADCLALIRELLSFMPQNNQEDPPRVESAGSRRPAGRSARHAGARLSPTSLTTSRKSSRASWTTAISWRSTSTSPRTWWWDSRGSAGKAVGIVANQPAFLAGCLDINASVKGARFVRFCDAFNIPLITFEDVPGFLPGTQQEYGGIIRHGAKLLFAYAEATVPKITLITRKAYGGAYCVMASKHLRTDVNLAYPTAEIAVMGPEGAVNIVYRRELQKAEDPEQLRREKVEEFRERFANPYIAAETGLGGRDHRAPRYPPQIDRGPPHARNQARHHAAQKARKYSTVIRGITQRDAPDRSVFEEDKLSFDKAGQDV